MKRKLLYIGIPLALLLGWFLYQQFGPTPTLKLGKSTTYITEPLAEDGLPDYAAVIFAKQREGVTPENNGAVPFWRAMGPQDYNNMEQSMFQLACDEIGLENLDTGAFLVPAYTDDQIYTDFGYVAPEVPDGEYGYADDMAASDKQPSAITKDSIQALIEYAKERPWTAEQYPPLASWVKRNNQALDLLVEAGKRPEFYSPSPSFLNEPNPALLSLWLTSSQVGRSASRELNLRGMLHLGEGRVELAWQDFFAIMQLGNHIARGDTCVEKLIGIAMRDVAMSCLDDVLNSEQLTEQLARKILSDLQSLPMRVDMAGAIDRGERFMFLDSALRVTCGRFGERVSINSLSFSSRVPSQLERLAWKGPIDATPSLKLGNRWYNRLANAARITDRKNRQAKLKELDNEMQSLGNGKEPSLFSIFASESVRSQQTSEKLVSLFLPALPSLMVAEDRLQANLELHRIATALAVYHLEQGSYPKKLETLAPTIMGSVPNDLFANQPYRYDLRDDGYLLYSIGKNEIDDNATDNDGIVRNSLSWRVINGEWTQVPKVESPERNSYSDGAYGEDYEAPSVESDLPEGDDLVIRMPLPKVEWPTLPQE